MGLTETMLTTSLYGQYFVWATFKIISKTFYVVVNQASIPDRIKVSSMAGVAYKYKLNPQSKYSKYLF